MFGHHFDTSPPVFSDLLAVDGQQLGFSGHRDCLQDDADSKSIFFPAAFFILRLYTYCS